VICLHRRHQGAQRHASLPIVVAVNWMKKIAK